MNKLDSILANLKPHLTTNKALIVSVSGGVDSMSLLHFLYQNKLNIVVVHFNHLTRPETVKEAELVQSFCEIRKIPFYSFELSVPQSNFHHQAHRLRAYYLESVAKQRKTPFIVTAHHLNDLFETMLISQTRGGHLLSYAGMQVTRKKGNFIYLKPCLYLNKQQLMTYAKENAVPFLDDYSNESHAYLRNRYRHSVIPFFYQENDNLNEQIINYHTQVTKAHNFIRDCTLKLIDNKTELSLVTFKQQAEAVQEDMLACLFEMHQLTFNYRTILQIKKMILTKKPNNRFQITPNLDFIKAYDRLYIGKETKPKQTPFTLSEGANRINNMAIFTLLSKSPANSSEFSKLCYNELAFPLILRRRENGDRVTFKFGTKKLKDLLIDLKIPLSLRDGLWVLVDQNNQVLWIPHIYLNETLGDKNTLYLHVSEV